MSKKKNDKKTEQEKVDERREEVLSRGRKFKYPVIWTRHKIVFTAIAVAMVALALVVLGSWAALYRAGRTDSLLFNLTKIVPLPVAKVDGEAVRFSDYLMLERSAMISAEKQSGGKLGEDKTVLENRYKRVALTNAERYVLAIKLAKEMGISVSDEEVDKEFERHLKIGGVDRSEEGFIKIIGDNFGLTKSEYERILYLTLIRAKVEQAIDTNANSLAEQIEKMLKENGGDYQKVAEALGEAIEYENTGGLVDSKNIDGGRATEAMKLEPGGESGRFVSMNGDGFYFVKLIEKDSTRVNFESIKVPFTAFGKRFEEIQNEGKIEELVEIEGEAEG